ncbi:Zn(2)-C6 fungal-type domain-containing protein [Mycena sanguinolenta]|uniref:Zn(2)-C6 fungal-type domain-containing protein n=1 Tax=Mycena sanguinolenta TaxID=230812 RepID=A0A8H6XIF9_9AGAR|nr:Zn(2)-C6 fungal-type domain-containing protein [Mycena sanguinolenta]
MGTSPKEKEDKTRKKPGRVPTSCAECRRLKLRCDKNASSLRKMRVEVIRVFLCGGTSQQLKRYCRGCGSICPDGHLTSGKGNRLVLANTEELHHRIENLVARIRDLEDALRTLQESVSHDPHPLLRADLLHLKTIPWSSHFRSEGSSSSGSRTNSVSTLPSEEEPGDPRTEEENLIDAFGTLTIGPHGETSFLGQTARSEYLYRVRRQTLPELTYTDWPFPPRLSRRIIESCFPLPDSLPDSDGVDKCNSGIGREIFELLPPLSEAIRLCDMYLEHGSYLPITLMRTELIDEVLEAVYRAGSFQSLRNPHVLALLFVVFAIAAILDPSKNPYSIEAQEYYYLARASLSLASPVRETTRAAIQALIHMAQYRDLSDWEGKDSNVAWMYIGTAVSLAHGIGLHLNSSRWNLTSEACDRRSRLFWQLFGYDTWLSFSLGRPPSMSMKFIDAPFPVDLCSPGVEGSGKEMSYALWTVKYSVLMHTVMSSAFGCKMPSYNTILELDRQVRDFYIPEYLRPNCGVESPPASGYLQMQRFLVLSMKESTLLNLHRAYFAQALQDKPDDLANHRFIPSVMAAYRSAWRLIRTLVLSWQKTPGLMARHGSAWSPALSAAIVMCILITRAPTSKMTKSSLEELDALARLFKDAAPSCRFASTLLSPILILARRAHLAVDNTLPDPGECNVTPADLDRLGGKTHLVSQDSPSPRSTNSDHATPTTTPPTPPALYPRTALLSDIAATSSETMHPTIAQDMRSFDLGEPSQFYGTFPDPEADMAGIQFTGDSIFSSVQPGGGYGYQSASPTGVFGAAVGTGAGFASGPPMLDATWQNFVEQLGF